MKCIALASTAAGQTCARFITTTASGNGMHMDLVTTGTCTPSATGQAANATSGRTTSALSSGHVPAFRRLIASRGTFNFLSALEYFGQRVPTFPTYVLNLVSNLSRLLNPLGHCTRFNIYFDRDNAGRDAFGTLQGHNLPVLDQSELYQGHEDFNQFLTASRFNRAPSDEQ